MRIAIIAEPFIPIPPKKYGGTERVIYHQIKGLRERGHDVLLFATADSEVDAEIVPISDRHLFFGKDKKEQSAIIKEWHRIQKKTDELLRDHLNEVDIIHSHGHDLLPFSGFPNVTTLHGMFILEKMDYYEKRKDLFYVSISENQQESFPDLRYAGVVYNGLDPSEFTFVEEPEDYMCFLGRFDREKNPHQAIQLALQAGIKLKMAGKIDFLGADYFKEEIEPHFDNPLIEYLGEIGMEEKVKLISNAKANLHPTGFREPFGLTVLEAAYCGTPTMAIERGSMPELIEEGRTGLLVEDFAEGYHHLEQLFAMDRKYITERARLLFNYENMAEGYENAYQFVLNEFDKNKSIVEKVIGKELRSMAAGGKVVLSGKKKQANGRSRAFF